MKDDLIERLREYGLSIQPFTGDGDTCIEAADALEAAQKRIAELEAALARKEKVLAVARATISAQGEG